MDWARELGFGSVNFDLIYGLPHQTVATFSQTLETVLAMEPDRLAVFSYAHVPWIKPAQKILEQKILPSPEVKLELLKLVIERLTADDRYVYIGMDHFARPADELVTAQRQKTLQRNFQGYSTRGEADIYAFGMSAISQIPGAYWQNEKELPAYVGGVGRGPDAAGAGLCADGRRQDPAGNDHAGDVRPGAGLRRRCRRSWGLIFRTILQRNWRRWLPLPRTAW